MTVNKSPGSLIQARAASALDFDFNASLATLNLVRAAAMCMQHSEEPHVFSMASWKQCQFNERLLDVFMEKFALDPTWVKIMPAMTNSGLTALSPPNFCLDHCINDVVENTATRMETNSGLGGVDNVVFDNVVRIGVVMVLMLQNMVVYPPFRTTHVLWSNFWVPI